MRVRPQSSCHPNKSHHARGMCVSCYNIWLIKNNPIHAEKHRILKAKCCKLWYDRNKESVAAKGKLYRDTHRSEIRDRNIRRKLRIRGIGRGHRDCSEKIKQLKKESFCHWCHGLLSETGIHIDHILPLACGGKHVPDNLCASCPRCNLSKNSKLPDEWIASINITT